MNVRVDRDVCTGHGMCFMTAPEVFEDDEDGYGRARNDGVVDPGHEDEARSGAASCPERAVDFS